MGGRQGPSRRATLIGVFVVGLVLALSLPTIALAANTATFSYRAPASGSSLTNTQPLISTVVYDRYGVRGSRGVAYKMSVDGVQVPVRLVYYSGYGYRKFKLSYRPAVPLTSGIHTVGVYVKDLRGLTSYTSWKFRVDALAPVTIVDGVAPTAPGYFHLALFAVDNSGGIGVSRVYYKLDGGPTVSSTASVPNAVGVSGILAAGNHTVQYWSVDKLGNTETAKILNITIAPPTMATAHATKAGFDTTCGTPTTGCHASDLRVIHENLAGALVCNACHGTGQTPSNTCADCHTLSIPIHTPHVAIESSSTGDASCTQATCHGTSLITVATAVKTHASCATCHASASPAVLAVIAAGNAKCESCHTGVLHAGAAAGHVWTGAIACSSTYCHPSNVASVHTDFGTPPGCIVCHKVGVTPSTSCGACHTSTAQDAAHGYTHPSLTAGILTNSAICASCHGSDIKHVASRLTADGEVHVPAVLSEPVQEHKGCSCHAYGENAAQDGCEDCHAPHGFSESVVPWDPTGSWAPVGGHNTPMFDVNGATSDFSAAGLVVKDSMENTITQEWPLPTSGVFWSDSKGLALDGTVDGSYSLNPTDAPSVALSNKGFSGDPVSAIRTDVGWGSVITCYDCHTELEGLVGPQGANAANYGLDPNFPDDWTKAEITSFDPTGMRSITSTRGAANPYYPKWGSLVNMGESEIVTEAIAGVPSSVTTIYPGGFYKATGTSSNGYGSGVVTGRFICQKCHKLTNSYQGLGIEGNGRGFRSNNMNYMGFSNEAHMEHHADMLTGQANCVSCHISIPHGWKRPRLLVYESDPAPYKVQHYLPNYWLGAPSSQATATNPDLSQGNWGWLAGGTTLYKQVGAAIPNGSVGATSGGVWSPSANELDNALPQNTVVDNTGKTYSSHLERIAASDTAHKELVVGPADLFAGNDLLNGTAWGKWLATAEGSEWHPDTSPNALYSNEAIQNNCTACTSAGLTHSDTGGTSEGVAETNVPGRTPVGGVGTWTRIPYWK